MTDTGSPHQVWELATDSGRHRVEVRGSFSRRLHWYVDDELVVERRSTDDTVRLRSKTRPELGVMRVRFSGLGRPRRATLFEPDPDGLDVEASAAGIGGIDLAPERGSAAARHEQQLRDHPRRYAAMRILASIVAVGVSLLLGTVDSLRVLVPAASRGSAGPTDPPFPRHSAARLIAPWVAPVRYRVREVRHPGRDRCRRRPVGGHAAPQAGRAEGSPVRSARSARRRVTVVGIDLLR